MQQNQPQKEEAYMGTIQFKATVTLCSKGQIKPLLDHASDNQEKKHHIPLEFLSTSHLLFKHEGSLLAD